MNNKINILNNDNNVFCNLRNNTKMLFLDEILACADKKRTERLSRLFEYIK
jgi:hypothetical protein